MTENSPDARVVHEFHMRRCVDALVHEAEHELHEQFETRHVTLQGESPGYAQLCALRTGTGCS